MSFRYLESCSETSRRLASIFEIRKTLGLQAAKRRSVFGLATMIVGCLGPVYMLMAQDKTPAAYQVTGAAPTCDTASLQADMFPLESKRPAFTSDRVERSDAVDPTADAKVAFDVATNGPQAVDEADTAVTDTARAERPTVSPSPSSETPTGNEALEVKRPRSHKPLRIVSQDQPVAETKATGGWPYVDMLPLLAVLGLIVAAAVMLKRFMPAQTLATGSGALKIMARTTVSPKQNLMLVKLGGRLVLIGVSPERMNTLVTVEEPEEVASVLGQIESQRSGSMTQTFLRSFQDEKQAYADSLVEDDSEWKVRGQVRGLLDKVRRLAGRRDVA